ncbi:MAG: DnaT-like ssDNA-binding domain-containing protein [Porticoccaceae bacterium]
MSLIPEKPIVFSPTLAATLGLEEAILLQILQESVSHSSQITSSGYAWTSISGQRLLELSPFWNEQDIGRLTASLHEKGLLLVGGGAFSANQDFRFAFNEPTAASSTISPAKSIPQQPMKAHSAKPMANSWQPSEDSLRQLAQLGVTNEFARQQVPQFVAYWRDRNIPKHSWDSKYIKEVWRQWQQAETASYRKNKQQPITSQWQPSADAMDILCKQGAININFIEDAIPEFILYWRGTGEASSTWDSKFVQHVRRQWQFFNGMMNQDKSPQTITGSWQPNESVYDVLQMANIERDFAERLIPEFVLYWQENGSAQCSWSTKFLQYVKRQWARQSQSQITENNYGKQQGSDSAGRIRDRSIIDALSDRSWAS